MKAFDRDSQQRALAAGVDGLGLDLDAATLDKLLDYLALLAKWNAVYNLTAVRDPAQMVVQHLLDSLAVLPAFHRLAQEREQAIAQAGQGARALRVLDVGAGGGLPGMVLAITTPRLQLSLIDTVQKKTAFLTQVKAELGLSNVAVHTGRVEQLVPDQPFDLITSRAFADLSDFVDWSGHLLAPGGVFAAMKGHAMPDELDRLPLPWRVRQVLPLTVPGLAAERHLIIIEKAR